MNKDYLDTLKSFDMRPGKIKVKEHKEEVLLEQEARGMMDLHEEIIKWFMKNPRPADDKVHALAEKMGIDHDKFEGHIYMILSDLIHEGRSKKFNGKYNPKELAAGIEVEKEHLPYPSIAEKIAKDHLAEIPDYYTRLKKMEAQGGVKESTILEADVLTSTGFDVDMEGDTLKNTNFRKVLYTSKHLQLVLMSVKDDIGMETHDKGDQFIRIEGGKGKAIIDGREFPIKDGTAFIIPEGSEHNVINTGSEDLKLYAVYAPPNHPKGIIHKTKEEAESSEKD